jgi:uncharacterized protein
VKKLNTTDKIEFLKKKINEKKKLLVAFSGGVDSTVVAKLAVDVLGENSRALIVNSETYSSSELGNAENVARELGIKYVVLKFSELDNPEFVANPPDRCYICKQEFAKILRSYADEYDISTIADGVITSDFNEHRPGIKAVDEAGFWHPLVEAGVNKQNVRDIAKELGLSIHEKPSSACLSSRIPYGEKISIDKLHRIEKSEAFIRSLGFDQVRVRNYGNKLARIEVYKAEIEILLKPDILDKITRKLKDIGFNYITVDLEGYRSGSMDEVL